VFGVGVEQVLGFYIRGDYDLDELTLIGREERSYYYAGGARVAMRVGDGGGAVVYYLHADHLGSTSLATDYSGQEVTGSRTLYYPYGEQRWSASGGTLPTDFTYTGQRADSYTQLIHMGARWYDAQIGRWISADTIVPEPGNPQDLNRYSYVRNSPLNLVDPSGHCGGNILTGETYCPGPNTLTVDGNLGTQAGPIYGPHELPWKYDQRQAARRAAFAEEKNARVREAEYKAATAINASFLLINGVGGPLATAQGIPAVDAPRVRDGYGGLYYPQEQVTMAAFVDDSPAKPGGYRARFIEAHGEPPFGEWEVHHPLAQRYRPPLEAAGYDIHDPKYTRAVMTKPFNMHADLTKEQAAWHNWYVRTYGSQPAAEDIVLQTNILNEFYQGYFWPGPVASIP
jgi:RHS repeat-associated protein